MTQRPPRRNKRVTLLPDIVEDPQPLPDKRGTLGIFQFPWGERSDTASVSPAVRATMVMAMPGTMTSGGQGVSAALQARARQLESAEYSSSFFDEYDDDDEDMGGSEDEEEDEDSGDDFDETTLWEIASLLKTDSIPSKMSLFPPPIVTGEVVDDYLGDIPSDGEGEEVDGGDEIVIGLSEEQRKEAALWQAAPKTPGRGDHGDGLPHPDEGTWMKYGAAAAVDEPRRVKTRVVEVSVIETDSLWTPKAKQADQPRAWTAGGKPTKIPGPAQAKTASRDRAYHAHGGLWHQPTSKTRSAPSQGLFKVDPTRSDYRTTSAEPAAKNMSRKPRPAEHKPLDRLVSTGMWTKTANHHKAARFQHLSHGMWSPPRAPHHSSPSAVGLFTRGDRSRSDYRTTSLEPAAAKTTTARKPRPTEHTKPLDTLTSTTLWTAPSRRAPQVWLTATKLRRPPHVSRSDWAAALASALKSSYPSPSPSDRQHPSSQPADWAAALAEAMALSYPPALDPSTTHPVFFTSSSAEVGYTRDVGAVHPAAFVGGLPGEFRDAATVATKEEEREEERDVLAEQIRLLEEEKMFVARMAGEIYSQRVMPVEEEVQEEVKEEVKDMVGEEEELEEMKRSRSKREKEERRAQILAQIRAIEEGGELDTFGGKGRDVEEQGSVRKSGVVLRY